MDDKQLQALLTRLEQGQLTAEDVARFKQITESYRYLAQLVVDKNTTIGRLRKLFGSVLTEKTSTVLGESSASGESDSTADAADSKSEDESTEEDGKPPPTGKRKGHGRHGADAYSGAQRVAVPHDTLSAGDPCPHCDAGTVYPTPPGVLVRFSGQAPLQATVYELEKLRCNLCGKVFTAAPPNEAGDRKYDATAASMIGLLKYGTGMPFNRVAGLQRSVGVLLPPSTQWEIVRGLAEDVTEAYAELIRRAAQGDVVFNDDTYVKILELMSPEARQRALSEDTPGDTARTGLFTSGVVTTCKGLKIALYFSGHQHAGENLQDLLRQRAAELEPPIQMCDALSRNIKGDFETIVANCMAHARRKFVEVHDRFPDACRVVLKSLEEIYRVDALAKEQDLDPRERLVLHQAKSAPVMNQLHQWLNKQFDDKLVEPNSALGDAVKYLLKHWEKLTLFLRQPGAPLDNNICERALKKAILHRKNSLFYKTCNGARVGDCLMSLIYTCELNGANPMDYLTQLQQNSTAVAQDPAAWMPWNYQATIAQRHEVIAAAN